MRITDKIIPVIRQTYGNKIEETESNDGSKKGIKKVKKDAK